MIGGRVKTRQEVEDALREEGYEPTDFKTDTGRVWRSTQTGEHIVVPDPYEGMYPDFILRDLKKMIIDMKRTMQSLRRPQR